MDPSCDSFETPKRDLRGNSSKSADAKIINTVGTSAKILLRFYEPRNAQGKRKMILSRNIVFFARIVLKENTYMYHFFRFFKLLF
jgi:hypothetical protein